MVKVKLQWAPDGTAAYKQIKIPYESPPEHFCCLCEAGIPHDTSSTFGNLVFIVRKHVKKRNQSDKYHAKVQKKWDKRFQKGDPRMSVVASKVNFPNVSYLLDRLYERRVFTC